MLLKEEQKTSADFSTSTQNSPRLDGHAKNSVEHYLQVWGAGVDSVLTDEQRAIVHRRANFTVVFAAPGSGKTAVLTEHIASQIAEQGMRNSNLLAVTFTRQAAVDMKRRLQALHRLSQPQVEGVQIGTFHSQMFRYLLCMNPHIPVLLSPEEQAKYMKEVLAEQGIHGWRDIQSWLTRLNRWKSTWPVATPVRRRERRILATYESMKRRTNRWDFDDILIHFCTHLEGGKLHRSYAHLKYLLVDEFQDTNHIQWYITSTMAKTLGIPFFVVGDDDQSIYGFRGASPAWLLGVPRHFPESRTFQLSMNFRSDREIVSRASQLIAFNKQRSLKDVQVYSSEEGLCQVLEAKDETEEAKSVVNLCHDAQGTVAVLARTRKQVAKTAALWHASAKRDVQFRTFHDAKGKEWDEVHIVGSVAVNPYLLASEASGQTNVEEERRLFYVAMTRAKHKLYIHYPLRIENRRQQPSPFIEEAFSV